MQHLKERNNEQYGIESKRDQEVILESRHLIADVVSRAEP
jgi:hypothetical protein